MSSVPSSAEPVPMTEEQKFVFDLKGWLLLPGILEPDLLEACREHILKLKNDPGTVDPAERYSLAGPAQELLDHPSIVGILSEILSPDRGDAYGFRCESSFSMVRKLGQQGADPHCGPIVGAMAYQFLRGRIFSGLTRVAWELNEVKKGLGGTFVLSGSHKANFPVTESHRKFGSPLYESYSCPPGSVIIFSESCWHVGAEWKDSDHDRIAILNCYSTYLAQWHKLNLPAEVIARMPEKRRTLFRGVWGHDFHHQQPNNFYDEENRSL